MFHDTLDNVDTLDNASTSTFWSQPPPSLASLTSLNPSIWNEWAMCKLKLFSWFYAYQPNYSATDEFLDNIQCSKAINMHKMCW